MDRSALPMGYGPMGRGWAIAALALLHASPAAAGAPDDLDVPGWLARPGVRLVAVELYATWCKPCMEAVPRWRALHEKYRDQGLRLIVVSTQDPGGACRNPGWSPDQIVCDDQGAVSRALGAGDKLPVAFLWSWQGDLLVREGHVGVVEEAVAAWMQRAPRVLVEAEDAGPGARAGDLVDLLRAELDREGRFTVVGSEVEAARLHRMAAASLSARYDDALACEIGKDIPANALLRVHVSSGARKLLHLGLFSVERKCLVAASSAPWSPTQARRSAAEAVAALFAGVRREVQMPGGARPPPSAQEMREQAPAWTSDEGGEEVVVELKSEPAGAVVLEGTRVVCPATPCSRALGTGKHTLAMLKERHVERRESVEVSAASKRLSWKLEPDFGWITVRAPAEGAEVLVDGRPAGKIPLVRHEVAPGAHEIRVRSPCHLEWAKRGVAVARGAEVEEQPRLDAREGAVKVTAQTEAGDDVEAEIWIDGASVGRSPGPAIRAPICARSITVRDASGASWTSTLELKEGVTAKLAARLSSSARLPRLTVPPPCTCEASFSATLWTRPLSEYLRHRDGAKAEDPYQIVLSYDARAKRGAVRFSSGKREMRIGKSFCEKEWKARHCPALGAILEQDARSDGKKECLSVGGVIVKQGDAPPAERVLCLGYERGDPVARGLFDVLNALER